MFMYVRLFVRFAVVQLCFVFMFFMFFAGLLTARLCFMSDIVFYWLVDSLIDCIVLIYSAV